MAYFWTALVVGFGIIEASTAQLVCIWLAGGALGALFASLCNLSVIWQTVIFIIVSAILIAATRPLVKKLRSVKTVSTNTDALIGQSAVVTEDIDNLREKGAVKLGGITWTARSEDGNPILAESIVTVCRISGVKLYVKKED